MLLGIFSLQTQFFIDEKHTQWMLDTKVKVFHESILFHETTLKLYFMKSSERKISHCILPLTQQFGNIHRSEFQ